MRSSHSRSLVSSIVALALLLGSLVWLAPGAVLRRAEPWSGTVAAVDSSSAAPATAASVLEAEPAVARAPATPPVDDEVVAEPPAEVEPTRDDLVAQREQLERELTELAERLARVNESLASLDGTNVPAPIATPTRVQLGGAHVVRGFAYRSAFTSLETAKTDEVASPASSAPVRVRLFTSSF